MHSDKPEKNIISDDKKAASTEEAGKKSAAGKAKKPSPKSQSGGEKLKAKPKSATGRKTTGATTKKSSTAVKGRADNKKKSEKSEKSKRKQIVSKLLINTVEPEECRIALLEDGRIESFHVETISREQTKGNIYKGRIAAVEPNLQTAFVEIGTEKNGFLPFSDIHPEYYYSDVDPDTHWKKLKIQDVIRKGQKVLVEVVKESVGNKGPNMTTFLSIPGRYLVLMPGSSSAGISRKIDNDEQRRKLKEMMNSFNIPEGIGYIIRTASKGITKTALSRDMKYLINLWQEIKSLGQSRPAPSLVYQEQDIISRFLRDHFTSDIQEILVDSKDAYDQVAHFLELLPARQKKMTTVKLHKGARPIFNQYQVEDQIEQIYRRKVQLPSGGSIVINPTEALVAIDVNSGRTAKDKDFEATIFLANMEAAVEIARQLRLRDLGGLIVVDFIDMRESRNIREVEKKVKASMKRDKAKVDISRLSRFGLMQISRQKMASPIQTGSYNICEHCQGRGVVRSVETLALFYLRRIHTGITGKKVKTVECRLPIKVAQYLLNNKREDLLELEKQHKAVIRIEADPSMTPLENHIEFVKED
ncbi:MAG: Rne/Rng family ribonuclease [Thermodesulfobacteriota bacterium]|nr:Rne/Rng family ribonuclease [Thermodesulfobacteriota bacterium]